MGDLLVNHTIWICWVSRLPNRSWLWMSLGDLGQNIQLRESVDTRVHRLSWKSLSKEIATLHLWKAWVFHSVRAHLMFEIFPNLTSRLLNEGSGKIAWFQTLVSNLKFKSSFGSNLSVEWSEFGLLRKTAINFFIKSLSSLLPKDRTLVLLELLGLDSHNFPLTRITRFKARHLSLLIFSFFGVEKASQRLGILIFQIQEHLLISHSFRIATDNNF